MRAGCCVHTPIISYSLATTTADDKKELEPRGLVAKPKLKKALVLKFTRILRHGFVPAAEHHVSIPNRERTRWSGRVCLLLWSLGQYMVRLQTHWRSGISPTGYGTACNPVMVGTQREKIFHELFKRDSIWAWSSYLDLVHHTKVKASSGANSAQNYYLHWSCAWRTPAPRQQSAASPRDRGIDLVSQDWNS